MACGQAGICTRDLTRGVLRSSSLENFPGVEANVIKRNDHALYKYLATKRLLQQSTGDCSHHGSNINPDRGPGVGFDPRALKSFLMPWSIRGI
jgi:hypothetical protein